MSAAVSAVPVVIVGRTAGTAPDAPVPPDIGQLPQRAALLDAGTPQAQNGAALTGELTGELTGWLTGWLTGRLMVRSSARPYAALSPRVTLDGDGGPYRSGVPRPCSDHPDGC